MSVPTSIFALTAIFCDQLEPAQRTWGWYATLAEAENAVVHNVGDMGDCLYNWLVIEEVPAGVLTTSTARAWFEWDGKVQKWHKRRAPKWAWDLNTGELLT